MNYTLAIETGKKARVLAFTDRISDENTVLIEKFAAYAESFNPSDFVVIDTNSDTPELDGVNAALLQTLLKKYKCKVTSFSEAQASNVPYLMSLISSTVSTHLNLFIKPEAVMALAPKAKTAAPAAAKPAPTKPAAKKAPAKAPAKPAAKKPAAKKPAAKKPVAKKPVAKKPVAKKAPVKKAAAKPAAKKPVAKKPVAKKPVAKKPVAKKAAPKKPVTALQNPTKTKHPRPTPPTKGTKAAAVWAIANKNKKKTRKEILDLCETAGITMGSATVYYDRWRRYNLLAK